MRLNGEDVSACPEVRKLENVLHADMLVLRTCFSTTTPAANVAVFVVHTGNVVRGILSE
jgi:hypothetical protein